jgi:hypothetical protein
MTDASHGGLRLGVCDHEHTLLGFMLYLHGRPEAARPMEPGQVLMHLGVTSDPPTRRADVAA